MKCTSPKKKNQKRKRATIFSDSSDEKSTSSFTQIRCMQSKISKVHPTAKQSEIPRTYPCQDKDFLDNSNNYEGKLLLKYIKNL